MSYLALCRAFQVIDIGYELLYPTPCLDECAGCLFSDTWAAGDIVRGIAHEGKYVYYLPGVVYPPFAAYVSGCQYLCGIGSQAGAVHLYVVGNELSVVFVGSHHVGVYTLLVCLMCKCADNVVCLIALYLEDGDMVCLEYVLDYWYGKSYCLGCLLALCLVFGVCFVAEGASAGVECYSDVCRLHIPKYILEGVDKAENGTCVLALGVDSRILDKCVKCAVYERVCV